VHNIVVECVCGDYILTGTLHSSSKNNCNNESTEVCAPKRLKLSSTVKDVSDITEVCRCTTYFIFIVLRERILILMFGIHCALKLVPIK